MNARWLERNRETHRALLRALLAAARWCDQLEHREELALLLSRTHYVDTPRAALHPSLTGDRRIFRFHGDHANFPWRSHAMWMATQMLRWGQIEKPLDIRAAAAQAYRGELHREAASDLGLSSPASDEKLESLGGAVFDPAHAAEYATSFPLAALRVAADELAAAQRTPSPVAG